MDVSKEYREEITYVDSAGQVKMLLVGRTPDEWARLCGTVSLIRFDHNPTPVWLLKVPLLNVAVRFIGQT